MHPCPKDLISDDVRNALSHGADESLTSLAVYFRNWHMFREYMNNIINIPC